MSSDNVIVGTSGYSFEDWVGTFYPPGTRKQDMFARYVQVFPAVELNFTYYRMPTQRTLEALARRSPADFTFWVKANQELTHKHNRAVAGEFIDGLQPLRDAGKLAGVLMQFPQSFHRTVENRKYLAAAIRDFAATPLAVEFRHCSWEAPATLDGLRERNVALVVPEVPAIDSLYHSPPAVTSTTGYVRLHSRDASKWYASGADRYDYSYSEEELRELAREWAELAETADRVFAFFNNCHGGQAAENAEAFRRIMDAL
jgi:uncharacterized protein YecE (DUF72 family)